MSAVRRSQYTEGGDTALSATNILLLVVVLVVEGVGQTVFSKSSRCGQRVLAESSAEKGAFFSLCRPDLHQRRSDTRYAIQV